MRNTRRSFMIGAVAAAASPAVAASEREVRALYRRAIVIDTLGGPGGFVPGAPPDAMWTAQHIADAQASGLTAVNLTLGSVGNVPDAFEQAVRGIAGAEAEIAAHPNALTKILTAADIRAAKRARKLGLIYGFQDTACLGADVANVDLFHNLGIRIFQLTYNNRNLVADGCMEQNDAGLSDFGRRVVARLNERRALIDLSHAGARTQAEAIAASQGPVAITHTGCHALNDVPRNTRDEVLRALAEKGGVAGIYFMPFLRASGQFHAEDVIRHVNHALNVAGEDHVSIGTDGVISPTILDDAFRAAHAAEVAARRAAGYSAPGESDEVYNFVPEYNAVDRFERLALDLNRAGLTPRVVEKVLGANFLRLAAEVWGG
ncbi:MAG: dipeptidase [Hyphomonadaceae bacterium]